MALIRAHTFDKAGDVAKYCWTNAGDTLNSDTIAVFAVLPRYPRYYRGNGIEIHGSTAVMGLQLTIF